MKGIEPSYSAWEAAALPLSYTRVVLEVKQARREVKRLFVVFSKCFLRYPVALCQWMVIKDQTGQMFIDDMGVNLGRR